jgi:hypothetical protein
MSQRDWEVVSTFQRGEEAEIYALSLEEVISADDALGNRDTGTTWRRKMQHRIKELKQGQAQAQADKKESRLRIRSLIFGLIIGVAATVIGGLILDWITGK